MLTKMLKVVLFLSVGFSTGNAYSETVSKARFNEQRAKTSRLLANLESCCLSPAEERRVEGLISENEELIALLTEEVQTSSVMDRIQRLSIDSAKLAALNALSSLPNCHKNSCPFLKKE